MSTDVHTRAVQARQLGYHSAEQIINRLERMIIRNESYLSRRAARGTRNEENTEAITHGLGSKTCFHRPGGRIIVR